MNISVVKRDNIFKNMMINPATPKNQENELAMARTSNTAKGLSTAHLIIGIVVIVLAVIFSGLLDYPSGG